MNNKLDIHYGHMVPWYFRLLGICLITAGAVGIPYSPIGGPVSLLIGLFLVSTTEGTEFDPSEGRFREYNKFLWFIRTGQWRKLPAVEKIFVNPVRISQKMYTPHTMQSATFSDNSLKAFLKFETGEKIPLCINKNKDKLAHQLDALARLLNTQVIFQE